METSYRDWFVEMIRFYRRLGLFADGPFHGLSDLECKQQIEGDHGTRCCNYFQNAITSSNRELQLLNLETVLIAQDKSRVWAFDCETVHRGEQFYQNAISSLEQISRGTFHPDNACEEWIEGDLGLGGGLEKIIHVTFELNTMKQHIWIRGWGDFAHPGFILAVNRLTNSSGRAFRIWGDSQDWTVICQSDIEAGAMADRGHKCRETAGGGGVITFPDTNPVPVVESNDRWLYVRRGLFKYDCGDFDGAWQDWSQASKMGVPEQLYSKLSAILEMKPPKST